MHAAHEPVSIHDEYSVYRFYPDGDRNIVCSEASAVKAAMEFWRCTNNVSAMTGLIDRVLLVDGFDTIKLAWIYGRGYTYDGKHFQDRPVAP